MSAEPSRTIHRTTPLLYQDESYLIRGACFNIYKKFRNTQKESIYQKALEAELKSIGLKVEREKKIPIFHLGVKVGAYIPDILVENKIIIELKSKPYLHKDDVKQFWYYLKYSEFHLGFLVNFGKTDGVEIVRRVFDTARPNDPA
jgi:GxxExxY protein